MHWMQRTARALCIVTANQRVLRDPLFCFCALAISSFRRSSFLSTATSSSRARETMSNSSSRVSSGFAMFRGTLLRMPWLRRHAGVLRRTTCTRSPRQVASSRVTGTASEVKTTVSFEAPECFLHRHADRNPINSKNRPNVRERPNYSATLDIFGDDNSERIVTGIGVKLRSFRVKKIRLRLIHSS